MATSSTAFVFPGQGSQRIGMGKDVFGRFPTLTSMADNVLGFSVKDLCLNEKNSSLLNQTQYTQPALYVVNALHYYAMIEDKGKLPQFVAGHSLGEYNALLAADVFDFEVGLQLVKKRGELMAQARSGGMAAVIGLDVETVRSILTKHRLESIDIANYNAQQQIVIAGETATIEQASDIFRTEGCENYIPLMVSGAFHSRLMKTARDEFRNYVKQFQFRTPELPVIANVTAAPYPDDTVGVGRLLSQQIVSSVRWAESIWYLRQQGVKSFQEVGESTVLSNLIAKIDAGGIVKPLVPDTQLRDLATARPALVAADHNGSRNGSLVNGKHHSSSTNGKQYPPSTNNNQLLTPSGTKGIRRFVDDYQLKYPYVAGGIGYGISSRQMVESMTKGGMLGFLDIADRPLADVENDLRTLAYTCGKESARYGCTISQGLSDELTIDKLFGLLRAYNIQVIETHDDPQITEKLVEYRLQAFDQRGEAINRLLIKTGNPVVLEEIMKPISETILLKLQQRGKLTKEQVERGRRIALASDVCVLADPGGLTSHGSPFVLFPHALMLREQFTRQYRYEQPIHVGLGGGIGSPLAVQMAFAMGADFVHTTSVNLCTIESGLHAYTKQLLQEISVEDTGYAPCSDFLFNPNKKIQVVKKGVLFPARANKLYELFKQHAAISEIDPRVIVQLEEKFYQKSLAGVWEDIVKKRQGTPDLISKALQNSKYYMYLLFQEYFHLSAEWAVKGDGTYLLNFQIPCGAELGALNRQLQNTPMQAWSGRNIGEVAQWLLSKSK
ncbi:ACP S-malonyltransferase [Spirosoma fluviale]|uniref:[acyl-carrier-protein] S-malonyltransferase n=1 Tax=Spirosoma fluviale TaxID=1597977 RepID=A0A286GVG7_9BACT|nr:ACP S-malonyltransferase [Spirosoma fluviale]SOD99176.1 trans-AT polyketide synthase, acyltransferase and oxidoreductase domain-containing protein [Spirosoma fluviale]